MVACGTDLDRVEGKRLVFLIGVQTVFYRRCVEGDGLRLSGFIGLQRFERGIGIAGVAECDGRIRNRCVLDARGDIDLQSAGICGVLHCI